VFVEHRNPDLVGFIRAKGVTCLDISRMHAEGLPHLTNVAALGGIKIRTGGSAIPYATRRSIERSVSRHLYVRYATSETGAIAMAMPGEHDADECSGRPIDGVELRIVDASGSVVPQGTVGEIALRTPGMVTGYFDNEEQTAARFREGWFYPGDVGLVRSDGQLVVQGRKDEMIIMNGLNIFPKEIESVLESHPDVRIAAALALPSRNHGDVPVAAVELVPNSELSGPDIQRWAQPQLGLRSPKRIVIVDRLPRNSQGKVAKRELLPLFERK
jgi:acyl-CoA synthetase (AMP-forming)/AMP-acid ligase II